jgi:hypothetical protein
MDTIVSHKQKMRICPLFICPVTTNDVLIDGERVFGPALILYVHLMQTTQWNNDVIEHVNNRNIIITALAYQHKVACITQAYLNNIHTHDIKLTLLLGDIR